MALFGKRSGRVIRRGAAEEDRKVLKIKGQDVTVRRFSEPPPEAEITATEPKRRSPQKTDHTKRPSGGRAKPSRSTGGKERSRGGSRSRDRRPSRPHLEVVAPPESARKQMLVRSNPHQTQIVVLEGPVLVEHYVARSDQLSLVGNVYVGKVRNVLPGMEAAFVDFGEGKNGVLYAGDVNYDDAEIEGNRRRIEMVLKPGDSVLVQVVKDAMTEESPF